MEPFRRIPHHLAALRPETQATQTLFDCGNGLGLSAINAKGSRWDHGFYCGDNTFEVALIRFEDVERERFDLVQEVEPIGWLSIEELGALGDRVESEGVAGFTDNRYPEVEDD